MRLLLINPRFPESFWSSKWALSEILPGKRAVSPPLGLATLAALCPPHWRVEIVDENVEPIPLEPQADIVGICGMGVQFPRQKELLEYYRKRGHYVLAGGSYASLCPEQYESLADTVVAGEAEYIFKQFCEDFERGEAKPLNHETGTVALTDSPTPRFDLLKIDRYSYAALQFSRGCPFRCEFCDIIVMFGRKPRVKSLEQVGRELDELRRLNARSAFFVDDNLIGNLPAAKKLLQFLKEYQEKHQYWFSFGTEASLNMAQHRDLLELFRRANFGWVFIGIESTDPDSLKETLKTQNLHEDILTSIRRIYSYGIEVLAGFIIGFDHDTLDTFEQQYQFITDAGIQSAMIGLLTAMPKTPLYDRLKQDGRLSTLENANDNTRPSTNVIPKLMPYNAMVDGYLALYRRLLQDREIALRITNKLRHLATPTYRSGYSARQAAGILWRLIWKGILPGGPRRVWHFVRAFPILRPSVAPTVVSDWIVALSMREFAERRLAPHTTQAAMVEGHAESVRAAIEPYLTEGKVMLSLRSGDAPHLSVRVCALLDAAFFRRAAPRLEDFLEHQHASVTLRIDAFEVRELRPFQKLLRRLSRYGDRVSIVIDERLRPLVPVDSSVFDVVLAERGGPSRRDAAEKHPPPAPELRFDRASHLRPLLQPSLPARAARSPAASSDAPISVVVLRPRGAGAPLTSGVERPLSDRSNVS